LRFNHTSLKAIKASFEKLGKLFQSTINDFNMTQTWHYPTHIAHRGAGKLAPENTLAAFKLGYAHGYRMFECDVKLSSDGVAYLLHDATLERSTDGVGGAGDFSWHALSQLDAGAWHSAAYAGEPLPTLRNIAAFIRANDCAINIEIKPVSGTDAHTGEVIANLAAQLWTDSAIKPLLSSFSEVALEAAYYAQPSLPRALLVNRIPDNWRAKLERLSCVALDCNVIFLSDEQVRAVKTAGYKLLVYTCNDSERAAKLLALGVDGIITDAIDEIRA
jgi:glycerophosphoryl diester phosphodiesterase